MTGPLFYPPADRTTQWFYGSYPGVEMPRIRKVLLHSTEGGGWPAYDGGSKAPQLTYDPRKHQWRQHFPLNRSARALMDPEGTPVRENRDEVVQVEIVAYADAGAARAAGGVYVADLDAQAVAELGAFIAWMHRGWEVPLVKAPVWLAYPASYGANTSARMTSAEYDSFAGVLGHMHASGNLHGDPGSIPINSIMAAAIGTGDNVAEFTEAEKAKLLWLADQYAYTGSLKIQQNRIETALGELLAADGARYKALADQVSALDSKETNRYAYYADRFAAILAELQADPESPVGGATATDTFPS